MKTDIKAELLREIALEVTQPQPDIGMRAGIDPFHPTHRGRAVTSFAVFDPLGIHSHPELIAAYIKGAHETGVASNVGRSSGGATPALATAESRIANFFGAESATIFSSRNQCVLTLITTLCGEGSMVLGQSLTPLPLADACTLVGAEFLEFEGLEKLRLLLQKSALAKRLVVIVESTAFISGEIAPLQHLLTAIEHVGGWAFVDESMSLGWSGIRGAGGSEAPHPSPVIAGRIVGFQGIAGSEVCALVSSVELRELLSIRSRYLKQEPVPSGAELRRIVRAIDLAEVAIATRERLLARVGTMAKAIRAQGWRLMNDSQSPILSIWFDSLLKANVVQEALLQRGIYLEALPARGLRRNGAVVRILVSNGHAQEEVQRLLSSLDEVKKRLENLDA